MVELVSVTVVDTAVASTLHALVTSWGAKVARALGAPSIVLDVGTVEFAGTSSGRALRMSGTAFGAGVMILLFRLAMFTVCVKVKVVLMTSVKVVVGVL